MDAFAASRPATVTGDELSLEREFQQRLAESGTLAFRVALAVLRDRADAEDVAQEALLRAYRNFRRLRDRGTFRSWLVRIAWRAAIDHQRERKRRERREEGAAVFAIGESSAAGEQDAEKLAAGREFSRQLNAALDSLSEKLRMVMILAAIEGYDTREVAQLLGLPENTVKSRLRMARKKLAEKLRT